MTTGDKHLKNQLDALLACGDSSIFMLLPKRINVGLPPERWSGTGALGGKCRDAKAIT